MEGHIYENRRVHRIHHGIATRGSGRISLLINIGKLKRLQNEGQHATARRTLLPGFQSEERILLRTVPNAERARFGIAIGDIQSSAIRGRKILSVRPRTTSN